MKINFSHGSIEPVGSNCQVTERHGIEMKVDELIDAIGKIDPKYVEEAEQKRSGTRRRQMAFAACLALFVLVGISGRIYLVQNESAGDCAMPEESYHVSMDEEANIGEETTPDEKFESAEEETANTDIVMEESAPSEQAVVGMLEESYGVKLATEKLPEDLTYQAFDMAADAKEGVTSLYYESGDGERSLKISISREKEALSGRIFEKDGVYFTLESKNLTEAEQQTLEVLVQTQGRK